MQRNKKKETVQENKEGKKEIITQNIQELKNIKVLIINDEFFILNILAQIIKKE
jgi:hypothetical protein